MKSGRGFTLIELMVTLVVLGVLLSIGIPVCTDRLREDRLTAQSNNFLGALIAARSEAVKTNKPVQVKPADSDWQDGWMVALVGASDEPLRDYQPLDGDNTLICDSQCQSIVFRGVGSALSAETFVLCNPPSGQGRRIDLHLSGKAEITRGEEAC